MGSVADYSAKVWLKKTNDETETEPVLSVSTDIYNNEDDEEINQTYDVFVITQEFIDSLKPSDELILEGDGYCF